MSDFEIYYGYFELLKVKLNSNLLNLSIKSVTSELGLDINFGTVKGWKKYESENTK
jgi:hypothetical protein